MHCRTGIVANSEFCNDPGSAVHRCTLHRVRETQLSYGHFTTGGIEDRIDSTLPPVRSPKMVPRS